MVDDPALLREVLEAGAPVVLLRATRPPPAGGLDVAGESVGREELLALGKFHQQALQQHPLAQ
eukprot:7451819-Alexandrium_andersonii.AAC.1